MILATDRVAPEKADFRPALLSRLNAGFLPEKPMSTFWEKYKDPRWQKRRLQVMELADFSCCECGDKTSTLNVHHKLYRKGADPWDYEDHELICLCEPCHELHHGLKKRLDAALALGTSFELAFVVGYAMGIFHFNNGPTTEENIVVYSHEEAAGLADAFGGIDEKDIINSLSLRNAISAAALFDLYNAKNCDAE